MLYKKAKKGSLKRYQYRAGEEASKHQYTCEL